LLDRGFSHRAITFFLVAVNLVIVSIVFLERSLNCTVLIFSVFAVFFSLIAVIYYLRPAPRLFVARTGQEESAQLRKASKFVSLKEDSILEQKN